MDKKSVLGSFSLAVATLGLAIIPHSFNSGDAVSVSNFPANQFAENNLLAELPPNPYKVGDYYNATAYFKCSVGEPNHDEQCPGGIVRKGNGVASVVVQFPNNYEVQYDFNKGNVTTTFGGKLDWGKDGDEWYIGITEGNDKLFIIIPDAAVYGG